MMSEIKDTVYYLRDWSPAWGDDLTRSERRLLTEAWCRAQAALARPSELEPLLWWLVAHDTYPIQDAARHLVKALNCAGVFALSRRHRLGVDPEPRLGAVDIHMAYRAAHEGRTGSVADVAKWARDTVRLDWEEVVLGDYYAASQEERL